MLNPHYPLHYGLTRSYARAALKELQEALGRSVLPDVHELAGKQVFSYLQDSGWRHSELSTLAQETQGLLSWLEWATKGTELWTVSAEMGAAFERSDCGDLQISDVLSESKTRVLYIHFDNKGLTPIKLNEAGSLFEGAYVISYPESLRIVLCSRLPADTDVCVRWQERYDLRVAAEYHHLAADEALKHALADDLQDLDRAALCLQQKGMDTAQATRLRARMQAFAPQFQQALQLVLCALAYRTAYPDEFLAGWAADAPERLTRMADAGSPKEKARAKSKLWSLGHVPVVCLGDHYHDEEEPDLSRGTTKVHWRRGHWRHQPYGQGNLLRKLLWIRPMRVGRA